MSEPVSIENLRGQLTSLRDEALEFYSAVGKAEAPLFPDPDFSDEPDLEENETLEDLNYDIVELPRYNQTDVGKRRSQEDILAADSLARRLKKLMVQLSSLVKGAALLGEPDIRDLSLFTKKMSAALRFRRYRQWGIYIHHDEGAILGVDPPRQSEDEEISLYHAHQIFEESYRQIMSMTDLVSTTERSSIPSEGLETSSYRPGTAFIMMQIGETPSHLDDVLATVRDVFKKFGIKALRAGEIEHDDVITSRILDEIATSEFLFADLTGERPSVYYEVGYAHAIKKHPILYRKKGTKIHFDLAHRNCPEYSTFTDLRDMLQKRLVEMTGRELPAT